jgi:hypothetical protein
MTNRQLGWPAATLLGPCHLKHSKDFLFLIVILTNHSGGASI